MQSIGWPIISIAPARLSMERMIGVLAAVVLHAVLVAALTQRDRATPATITPPAPLMVGIVTAAKQAVPKPPQAAQPVPAKPKAAPAKPKPQPKRTSEPAKREAVIAASGAGSSSSFSAQPADPPVQETVPAAQATRAESAPISPPHLNANYLDNPAPAYPPQSRSEGEQGKVLLRVLVNAHGVAEQVDIRRSSGYIRLDEAARIAVRQWKFVPAQQNGQPLSAWVLVPISFSLEG
ncbi:TonB family protein [Candidatus Methylospira mobilis]|uniref:TonB family protein n=1 Tax=Candidatus Methylospira mobilis TaxID=1808979 RepID=A0A5Q0BPM6_9GAMM|nr:energy transducer TonB [Candidatus Methylospira mobilis]QFY44241.1 TonB family protein [Candidatus Methylospira mobilis]